MNTLADFSAAAAGEASPDVPTRSHATGYTAILLLEAPQERVFRELADIENLPHWAGSFCERVYVRRGRWAALTSLGELYVALEAVERAGEITLRAGWSEDALHALPLRIGATDTGGTRVTFTVSAVTDEDHARLCRALGGAWPGLVARLFGPDLPGAEWRAN
ncbi:MAG: SRPBCC family protein [Verrucomicrobia bacterium]|nr:SRPBCC family protein [Verrucomicrobiota bacterium]